MGVIRGHQASHDFWGAAKLQSGPGANNPSKTKVAFHFGIPP